MTIVVTVRANDGIVLASDSATTFSDESGLVVKVYNSANKIFNLVKGWPVGAMTFGAGAIGQASISTLSKDLRDRLTPEMLSINADDLELDSDSYTIEQVAEHARDVFRDAYVAAYPEPVPNYFLGYRVCGYSAKGLLPEAWEVRLLEDHAEGPDPVYEAGDNAANYGPRWAGETEALDRIIMGLGSRVGEALAELGVEDENIPKIYQGLAQHLYTPLHLPAMPIQDAIDLAHFLVETAVKFTSFSLRAATIGGPIEVATITKHEGFKWVNRKHYYSDAFNPEG